MWKMKLVKFKINYLCDISSWFFHTNSFDKEIKLFSVPSPVFLTIFFITECYNVTQKLSYYIIYQSWQLKLKIAECDFMVDQFLHISHFVPKTFSWSRILLYTKLTVVGRSGFRFKNKLFGNKDWKNETNELHWDTDVSHQAGLCW